MVPTEAGPNAEGRATDPTAPATVDPLRVAVQGLLAIYLTPVIVVVCLIGVTSMVAGGVARIASRMLGRPGPRERPRTAPPARVDGPDRASRPIGRRDRSRVVR